MRGARVRIFPCGYEHAAYLKAWLAWVRRQGTSVLVHATRFDYGTTYYLLLCYLLSLFINFTR